MGSAIRAIAALVAAYAFVAFTQVDLNPSHWSELDRWSVILIAVIGWWLASISTFARNVLK